VPHPARSRSAPTAPPPAVAAPAAAGAAAPSPPTVARRRFERSSRLSGDLAPAGGLDVFAAPAAAAFSDRADRRVGRLGGWGLRRGRLGAFLPLHREAERLAALARPLQ